MIVVNFFIFIFITYKLLLISFSAKTLGYIWWHESTCTLRYAKFCLRTFFCPPPSPCILVLCSLKHRTNVYFGAVCWSKKKKWHHTGDMYVYTESVTFSLSLLFLDRNCTYLKWLDC